MPLFEYQCEACEHRFEKIQKFSDPLEDACPACGGSAKRLPSSPAIQFRGSGFYITDYAKKSSSDAGTAGGGGGRGGGRRTRRRPPAARIRRRPPRRRPTSPGLGVRAAGGLEIDRAKVFAELVGKIGTAQREVHDRLQESE